MTENRSAQNPSIVSVTFGGTIILGHTQSKIKTSLMSALQLAFSVNATNDINQAMSF